MVDHVEVKDNYVIILKYFRGSNINQLIKSYQSYKFYGILRHHHVLLLNNEVGKYDNFSLFNDPLKMQIVMYICNL